MTPEVRLFRTLAWAAFALAACVVVYFTLRPGPGGTVFMWRDKVQHFGAYATLAFLATLAATDLRRAVLIAVLLAVLGYALEVLQTYVGRSYDLFDAAANALGCLAGVSIGALIRRIAGHV